MSEQKQPQQKTMMLIIAIFAGGLGIHRLMMGHSNWWMMLLTAGGCGIWTILDVINIATGKLKMADGQDLI